MRSLRMVIALYVVCCAAVLIHAESPATRPAAEPQPPLDADISAWLAQADRAEQVPPGHPSPPGDAGSPGRPPDASSPAWEPRRPGPPPEEGPGRYMRHRGGGWKPGAGRGDRFDRGFRREDEGDLSPEEIDAVMRFSAAEFPMLHQKLARARDMKLPMFRPMINRVGRPMLHMMRMRDENPKLAEEMIGQHRVELELFELRRQYTEAGTDEERSRLKDQIRSKLETGFNHRLEFLKAEIAQFEARLDKAKKELARQQEDRSKLIDQHLENLLSGKEPSPFSLP